ncbi:MAG: rubrerythrin [Deltaproteobacteria bacterium]|nr:rubrerythrin [Deltaproteobacteria bacterium]MCL5276835.1 rubrerythrin [Deltaproteobacteria bacterium]
MENRDKELLKVLRTADEAEKEALLTYLKFARQTGDIGGKNMFIRLATDEYGHMVLLDNQINSVASQKGWQSVDVDKSVVEPLLPRISEKDIRTMGKADANELSALEAARALEQRAISYYSTNAKNNALPEIQTTFKRLAEMEQAHLTLIEAEIDSVKKTGFWFDTIEYSVEM